jgi:hypothetical protein
MKIKLLTASLAALLAVALTGCSMSNRDAGTIIGGGAGALAGQALTGSPYGMVAGAVAGGLAGNYIGGKSS